MHFTDFLDPLRRRMMRGVRAAWHVVNKKWLFGRDLLEFRHVLDGLVGHGGGEVPARMALKWEDGTRVAIQVRLPLTGITADEAIEVFEAHTVRPLVEGTGLGRLI